MMNANRSSFKLSMIALTLAMPAAFGVKTWGQEGRAITVGDKQITGLPEDWSLHHIVFSNPGTEEDAIRNGTYDKWLKIVNDPRYIIQQLKRRDPIQGPAAADISRIAEEAAAGVKEGDTVQSNSSRSPSAKPKPVKSVLEKDWSESMKSISATVGADNYPAKYSFAISNPTTANCGSGATPDYVVYNTGVAGSSSQANIVAYDNLYVNSGGTGLCSGTAPSTYWAYNTGAGVIETSVVLSLDGSQVAFISSPSSGAASLGILNWNAGDGTVGAPTTPTSESTPTAYRACTGTCMFTVAFNNGLNDTTSSPFYDYFNDLLYVGDASGNLHKFGGVFAGLPGEAYTHSPTGTGSLNGTNVITLVGGGTFTSGDIGATITDTKTGIPTNTTITAVTSSTTATMSATATTSNTGGTITLTSAWPVSVASGALTSPIWDLGSGYIYVNTKTPNITEVTPAGVVTKSATITGASTDIAEAPLVDPVDEKVYVFLEGSTHNIVDQFVTGFAASAAPAETADVGAGGTSIFYIGAFDNGFYNTETGNLYVCGNTGGDATLYQIPITSGVMSTTVNTGPTLTSATTKCSPVSEIYNTSATGGPYDWIYVGLNADGVPSGCSSGGCVMGAPVTGWLASTAYAKGQMVVNNHFNIEVVTTAGTSGSAEPTWPSAGVAGTVTSDGSTLKWTSEGPFTFTGFVVDTDYSANTVIVDPNNNLQRVTTAGFAYATPSSWNATFGDTTTAGNATFTNQGPLGINGAEYTGGTSGIVIDNTGAATGASNIYFSTLGSETCATSGGTAGCAVQASQSAP